MSEIVKCVLYEGGRRVREFSLDELAGFVCQDGQFVWIGVHEPTDELLGQVQQRFALHDLAIEDARRAHQRPKLEEYGDSLFLVLRTALWDEKRKTVKYGETHFFVGSHYLVSVRHGASTPYSEVRTRSESVPQMLRRGPAYALYAIVDFIVDNYFPVVDGLEAEVESLEARLFSDDFNPNLTRRIYRLRRELSAFKRTVLPLLEVFHKLTRADLALVPEDIRVYFRDVHDHTLRINEAIDTLRELLHAALEANLALVSVRQNETMKMLAAWAAILAVPTMVAGIYGMNFEHLPGAHVLGGFHLVVGATAAVCLLLHWRFKRIGWL